MIVRTWDEYQRIVRRLVEKSHVAFDTETTGLRPYHSDKLFSVVFADDEDQFYFNFHDYTKVKHVPAQSGEHFWPRDCIKELQPIFSRGLRFAHNAKFDMGFLTKEGISFGCEVHDTEVVARLIFNQHMSYSLDNCAIRDLNEKKDDKVKEYMDEHKLFEKRPLPGKSTEEKFYWFDEVPFEIIAPYALKDGELTYKLGMLQLAKLDVMERETGEALPSIKRVYETEKKLTKVCFSMEQTGIRIDREYCERAIKHEVGRYQSAENEFWKQTGTEFVNSGKALAPVFEKLGFKISFTDKGNPEITDQFLESIQHPVAETVRTYRDAHKRANTYFQGFLYHADKNDIVHANMRQSGTSTGRFSYWEPNLQNVTKDSDAQTPFPIRRAFVPREGRAFVAIDYRQMEFRMMLDYAQQMDLIHKILAGYDPHDATSELTGLLRKDAKILNFGLLYGMGLVKLAFSIMKLTPEQAIALKQYDDLEDKRRAKQQLPPDVWAIVDPILKAMRAFKRTYFDALPMVEGLIKRCTITAEQRGWIFDWTGRRFYFDHPRFAYRATNAIIQGGCAGVVKNAMVGIHPALEEFDCPMLLQVHDELVFEPWIEDMKRTDLIKSSMENVYPAKHLPLTCSVSHSLKSWGDMVEGEHGEKAGNEIQGASA